MSDKHNTAADLTSDVKPPSRQEIYDWIKGCWQTLSAKDIISAFLEAGISNSLDGKEDSLSHNIATMKEFDILKKQSEEPIPIPKGDIEDMSSCERMEIEYEKDDRVEFDGRMMQVEDGFEEDVYSSEEIKEEEFEEDE